MSPDELDGDDDSSPRLLRLKYELQNLAMPGEVQVELHRALSGPQIGAPAGQGDPGWRDALVAEDCSLGFYEWWEAVTSRMGDALTEDQRESLAAIDESFTRMSDLDKDHLWTTRSLVHAPEWADLRRLASLALEAFGWEVEPPPQLGRELVDFAWREDLPDLTNPETNP